MLYSKIFAILYFFFAYIQLTSLDGNIASVDNAKSNFSTQFSSTCLLIRNCRKCDQINSQTCTKHLTDIIKLLNE